MVGNFEHGVFKLDGVYLSIIAPRFSFYRHHKVIR